MAGPWDVASVSPAPSSASDDPWAVVSSEPQQQPSKPMRQAQQDKGFALNAIDYVNGIADWPDRLMASGVGLVAKGTDAIGLTNGADAMFSAMRNDAPRNKYASAGAIVGDIGATLPLNGIRVAKALPQIANAGRAVKGGARIGDAALQGSTATLATSSSNDAPLGDQLTLGAGISAAVPTLGMVARGGKNLVRGVIGETTGAGGQSLTNAYQAGRKGGDASAAFTESLRDKGNWKQSVDDATAALKSLRDQRGLDYRAGMVDISKDATVLDFAPVDKALASSIKTFKGIDISPKTAEARKEIGDLVAKWRGLDPAEYHTPEGMDSLKQMIGEIKDSYPYDTPARAYAEGVYSSLRGTIAKQAPAYDKVMREYTRASDEIDSLAKEFSLNKKANPNTALRKLQSIMRDNANTSWGQRASMGDRLVEAGATNLPYQLAGQALSNPIPRGLAKYADMAALPAAAYMTGGAALAAAPMASPRLMGEVAHGAGILRRRVGDAANYLPPVPFPQISSPSVGLLGSRIFGQ